MTLRRALLAVSAIALLGGGTALALRRYNAAAIPVVQPVRGTALRAVYATGTVEATVMIPLAARTGAKLVHLAAAEGEEVGKGQLLAQLEDTDLQKTVAELKAREDYAAAEWKRRQTLMRSNSVSRAEGEQARADWEASRAARERAEAEAGYLRITAPQDGRIIRRDGEAGEFIPAGQPVFWFSCCAPLRITAEVDEEDIPLVRAGQKVLIRADAFEGRIFHGEVQSITPKGDPVARSYRVRVSLTEPTPLQIGMTAETNIIISERSNALLIPSSALRRDSLWLVTDGRLARQQVETGARGPEQTEILGGLAEDALVVHSPTDTLEEGRAVHTRPAATPPGP